MMQRSTLNKCTTYRVLQLNTVSVRVETIAIYHILVHRNCFNTHCHNEVPSFVQPYRSTILCTSVPKYDVNRDINPVTTDCVTTLLSKNFLIENKYLKYKQRDKIKIGKILESRENEETLFK